MWFQLPECSCHKQNRWHQRNKTTYCNDKDSNDCVNQYLERQIHFTTHKETTPASLGILNNNIRSRMLGLEKSRQEENCCFWIVVLPWISLWKLGGQVYKQMGSGEDWAMPKTAGQHQWQEIAIFWDTWQEQMT